MAYTLAVLDFDGVILNSEPYHFYVRNELISRYCPSVHYDASNCVGKSVAVFYRELLVKAEIAESSRLNAELLASLHFERVFESIRQHSIQAAADLLPFLDQLAARGIGTAVASSSQGSYVCRCLDHLGLRDRFSWICCGDDVVNVKPAPDVYQRVLELSGRRPADAFAVEDSATGAEAARRAGIPCFGYAGGREKVRVQGCRHTLHSFMEIIPLL